MTAWVLFIALAFADGDLGHTDPIEFDSAQGCEQARRDFTPAVIAPALPPGAPVARWESVCVEILREPKTTEH